MIYHMFSSGLCRYPSSRAYITARLAAADSKLPAAQRRNITEMMVSLATAEHFGLDSNLEARVEASYLLETRKQPFGRVSGGRASILLPARN